MDVLQILKDRQFYCSLERATFLTHVIAAVRSSLDSCYDCLNGILQGIFASQGMPMDERRWSAPPHNSASAFLQWIAAMHAGLALQVLPLRTAHPAITGFADILDIVVLRMVDHEGLPTNEAFAFFVEDPHSRNDDSPVPVTLAQHMLSFRIAEAALTRAQQRLDQLRSELLAVRYLAATSTQTRDGLLQFNGMLLGSHLSILRTSRACEVSCLSYCRPCYMCNRDTGGALMRLPRIVCSYFDNSL